MKLLKMILIALLALVAVLYGATELNLRLSGKQEGPRIQCDSQVLEISVRDGEDALLAGVTAADKQDGDLTDRIQILSVSKLITGDTAKVTYLVFDSDDNMHSLTRQIHYTDYKKPVFTIDQPLVYAKNEAIALLDRLTVMDVLDGDITDSVRVSTLSATSDTEVYTVSLQVTNSMGDTARITLPVILQESTSHRPEIHLSRQLVYLERGAAFSAASYVVGVTYPGGRGETTDVQIASDVDTQNPGIYMVYYRYPHNGTVGLSILTVVVE